MVFPRIVSRASLLLAASLFAPPRAASDVVTDWNTRAADLVVEARIGPPRENRVLAIVQTAVYEAVNAITRVDREAGPSLVAPPGASVEAAVVAANRAALVRLVSSRRDAIQKACDAALAALPEGKARDDGIAVGEKAAARVLERRVDDGADAEEAYLPRTAPAVYVPTVVPAVPQWPMRRPWLMATGSSFRPGPPPDLKSEAWARAFQEIRSFGGRTDSRRSAEQTAIARFWEATVPQVYQGIVHSVARQAGRDVTRNARLLAAVAQGIDDALIAVFDAKYRYSFWRPVTAIRNAGLDGNDATEPAASWMPMIETPMHPEYPCAHCIVASTVVTVLKADLGADPFPRVTSRSPTAGGAERAWASPEELTAEVANARVWAGVHYRFSTEVGAAMGRQVGALAARRFRLRGAEDAAPEAAAAAAGRPGR